MELVQKDADVNRPREAEEFDPVYVCTEHERAVHQPFYLHLDKFKPHNHSSAELATFLLLTGTSPPKAPAQLFPGMLGVGATQRDAVHTPSPWSCKGIPTETTRPRLALPQRTSVPHTHPGIKGHDHHDHGPSFLPLHR